ncbi:MAG: hypothetical protein Q4C65_07140 [Eubacteriales bacterium]|nr:hypothetical protein [Eubacteriales bacterium]
MADILKKDGISLELLEQLSFHSKLGINLKKNLHYFDEDPLFEELASVNAWYDTTDCLCDIAIDYRIKSLQSARLKYNRYYPDHQTGKVFNDMLGFRALCDDYEEVLALKDSEYIRIADMSKGKAHDDGYRGVHVYFQLSNFHYPIEIQYNTYYDRQLNNWLHKYVYKKNYPNSVGCSLRAAYESGTIKVEKEFKEVLNHVLFDCEEI